MQKEIKTIYLTLRVFWCGLILCCVSDVSHCTCCNILSFLCTFRYHSNRERMHLRGCCFHGVDFRLKDIWMNQIHFYRFDITKIQVASFSFDLFSNNVASYWYLKYANDIRVLIIHNTSMMQPWYHIWHTR